jgi:hypothetical protein
MKMNNSLELLKQHVETSWLNKLSTFERRREQLSLSDEEKEKLKPVYYLSNYLESKGFFYVSKLDYSAQSRILKIEFIDNPDIPIEHTTKVIFTFSQILYFSDTWDDDLEELKGVSNLDIDSPIFFDICFAENHLEYTLRLTCSEITFRTNELPQIS